MSRRAKGASQKGESGPLAARLRELQGSLSVNAFAKKCGLWENAMRQYLEGASPGHEKLAQIARANGVTVDWLATGEEPRVRGAFSRLRFARDAAVLFVMRRSSVPEAAYHELMEEAYREQLDVAALEKRHGGKYPAHAAHQTRAGYSALNPKILAAAASAVEARMPQVSVDAKAQVIAACYERMAAEGSTDAAVVKDLLDAIAGLATEPEPRAVDHTWPMVSRRHRTRRKADEK